MTGLNSHMGIKTLFFKIFSEVLPQNWVETKNGSQRRFLQQNQFEYFWGKKSEFEWMRWKTRPPSAWQQIFHPELVSSLSAFSSFSPWGLFRLGWLQFNLIPIRENKNSISNQKFSASRSQIFFSLSLSLTLSLSHTHTHTHTLTLSLSLCCLLFSNETFFPP